jgi:hypothetical protein
MTNEHELHREEIERAVRSAIEEWRSKLWEIEFKGTAIGKVGIMTDKALQSIVQSNANLKRREDFTCLSTKWPLCIQYGEELLSVIEDARSSVYLKWQKWQDRIDMEKKKNEEAEAARKAQMRKERELETYRKRRDEMKRKRAEYDEKVRLGKKPCGRAPRMPSPSPEPGPSHDVP